MSLIIPISVVRDFESRASIDSVYRILADIPTSVRHFPKVEELMEIDTDRYRWRMERMGSKNRFFQIQYQSVYRRHPEEKWVRWEPIGEGNASFRGCWELQATDNGTRIHFENEGHVELPFPRVTRRLVTAFVERQFEQLLEEYIVNLQRSFSNC